MRHLGGLQRAAWHSCGGRRRGAPIGQWCCKSWWWTAAGAQQRCWEGRGASPSGCVNNSAKIIVEAAAAAPARPRRRSPRFPLSDQRRWLVLCAARPKKPRAQPAPSPACTPRRAMRRGPRSSCAAAECRLRAGPCWLMATTACPGTPLPVREAVSSVFCVDASRARRCQRCQRCQGARLGQAGAHQCALYDELAALAALAALDPATAAALLRLTQSQPSRPPPRLQLRATSRPPRLPPGPRPRPRLTSCPRP